MLRVKNISIRTRLIFLFLSIIIFTSSGISVFSYKASESTIKNQSQGLISGYLDQTVKRFDLFMENVHRTSMSIAFNKDLVKMLTQMGWDNYEQYNNLLRINDLISTFNNANRIIYFMNIYDFKSRIIIPSRGSRRKLDPESEEYRLIEEMFLNNPDAYTTLYKWIGSSNININGIPRNFIRFIMPVKDTVSGGIIGCVVTYVPEEYISSMCREMSFSSGGSVVILDTNGHIISSSDETQKGKDYTVYLKSPESSQASSYIQEVGGEKYLISMNQSEQTGWKFLSVVAVSAMVEDNTRVLKNTFVFISIGTIMLAFLLSFIINSIFYKPIRYLIEDIRVHGTENIQDNKLISRNDEVGFIFKRFNQILSENRELVRNDYEQKIHLKDAEIRLLHSQINPHFLYNSLDSIIWLLMFKQYDQIKSMVKAMVKFFRESLNTGNEIVSVKQVQEQLESYFVIQRIRYSDRLQAEIRFDPSIMEFKILKLLLQPVVENSICHGIEKKVGVGQIKVIGKCDDDTLFFQVSDNGVGVSRERLEEINRIVASEEQDPEKFYALQNINRRIKMFYGESYGLLLESTEGEGMTVSIRIPVLK